MLRLSNMKGKVTKIFFLTLIFLLSSCDNLQDTGSTSPTNTTTLINNAATATEETPEQKIEYIKLIKQIGYGVIFDLAWHPLNTKIAVATPLGIRFHHPDTLAEMDFWATPEPVMSLIYKSDGSFISGNRSGTLTFWDENGRGVDLDTGVDSICSLVLSPDEKWVAVSSCSKGRYGTEEQRVAIWNIEEKTFHGFLKTQEMRLVGVTFSPGSDTVSIYEIGHGVCTWNLADLINVVSCRPSWCDGLPCGPYKVIASPDGTRIAYKDAFAGIFYKSWGDKDFKYVPDKGCDLCDSYGLEYSPDSIYLGAGVMEEILVLDSSSGEIIAQNTQGPAHRFAFSPDGEKFVAVTQFGKLSLFDTKTAEKLEESENYWGRATAIAISPDQHQFVGGYSSGIIRAWGLFPVEYQYFLEIDLEVYALNYFNSGQLIYYKGDPRNYPEYFVKSMSGIFKSKSGELVTEIAEYTPPDRKDSFPSSESPDESFVVSGTEDETIIIHTPCSGNVLNEFQVQVGTITALGIVQTEDEYWILVAGTDGLVNIWAIKLLDD